MSYTRTCPLTSLLPSTGQALLTFHDGEVSHLIPFLSSLSPSAQSEISALRIVQRTDGSQAEERSFCEALDYLKDPANGMARVRLEMCLVMPGVSEEATRTGSRGPGGGAERQAIEERVDVNVFRVKKVHAHQDDLGRWVESRVGIKGVTRIEVERICAGIEHAASSVKEETVKENSVPPRRRQRADFHRRFVPSIIDGSFVQFLMEEWAAMAWW